MGVSLVGSTVNGGTGAPVLVPSGVQQGDLLQAHTSQSTWTPDASPSLWKQVYA